VDYQTEERRVTNRGKYNAELTPALAIMAEDLVLMGDMKAVAKKHGVKEKEIRNLLSKNMGFKKLVDELMGVVIKQVKTNIVSLAPDAINLMAEIMHSPAVEVQYRLKAAQDILNRAGIVAEGDKKVDSVVNIVMSPDMVSTEEKEIMTADYTVEDDDFDEEYAEELDEEEEGDTMDGDIDG
jgi:hypothetical protein